MLSNAILFDHFRPNDLFALSVAPKELGSDVNDAMPHIAKLTGLKHLSLELSNFGDAHVVYLDQLKDLKWLNVNSTNVTGLGISKFKGLRNLKTLFCSECRNVAQVLKTIAGSKNLSSLAIESHEKPLTDQDVKNIASCKKLHYLDMIDTSLTDRTLRLLATLPLLEELDLSGCNVSKQAIKEFNQSRSNKPVKIRKDW